MSVNSGVRELAGKRAELVVGDEPALLRAELLDSRQKLGATLLGHLEPQALGGDADRVEAALLAEHEPALGTDELAAVGLDRLRIVELGRDRTGLTREEGVAGHCFPRR